MSAPRLAFALGETGRTIQAIIWRLLEIHEVATDPINVSDAVVQYCVGILVNDFANGV